MKKVKKSLLIIVSVCAFIGTSYKAAVGYINNNTNQESTTKEAVSVSADSIPEYSGNLCVVLDGNEPSFTDEEKAMGSFENYSELDQRGRCGSAFALISKSVMPTEDRGKIGNIKPTGWETKKYDVVDGKYLYNRCHLIGFQLAGENANRKNLITGTRCLNVDGMLPYENEVAEYVRSTGNSVLYRVTPSFVGTELVCRGVKMEAFSIEDNGAGVKFNVFVYNVQDGVVINYADGSSNLG